MSRLHESTVPFYLRDLSIQRVVLFCFENLYWLCWAVCGIWAPQPGIEPVLLAMEAWSLNHWTTRVEKSGKNIKQGTKDSAWIKTLPCPYGKTLFKKSSFLLCFLPWQSLCFGKGGRSRGGCGTVGVMILWGSGPITRPACRKYFPALLSPFNGVVRSP